LHSIQTKKAFVLKRCYPPEWFFPYDFGFVPSTVADDGDPVDVLVLMDEPAFPGCLVKCRLIGVIEGEQEMERRRSAMIESLPSRSRTISGRM